MADKSLQEFLDTTLLKTPQNYIQNLLKTVHSKNITMEDWNMFVKQLDALIRQDNEIYNGFKATLVDLQTFDYEFAQTVESAKAEFKQVQDNAVAEFTELKNDADVYLKLLKDTVLELAPLEAGTAEFTAVQTSRTPNQAITENSIALGEGSIAGAKGYYFTEIFYGNASTNPQIRVSSVQPIETGLYISSGALSPNKLFNVPNYEAGDVFSLICNDHFALFGKIVSVTNDVITFTGDTAFFKASLNLQISYGHSKMSGNYYINLVPDYDDYTLCVPRKPLNGIVEVCKTAFSSGCENISAGAYGESIGKRNIVVGAYGHTEGTSNLAGYSAHAEGQDCEAPAKYSHAQNKTTKATGYAATSMGVETEATGEGAVSTGYRTKAKGKYSFSSGSNTVASGLNAVAIGSETTASGANSFAEGLGRGTAFGLNFPMSKATGTACHVEGIATIATDEGAHAENFGTVASGKASHSGGLNSKASGYAAFAHTFFGEASGQYSAAFNEGTKATAQGQFVAGRYNKINPNALFIVGNGTSDTDRSNAFEVLNDGDINGSSFLKFATGIAVSIATEEMLRGNNGMTLYGYYRTETLEIALDFTAFYLFSPAGELPWENGSHLINDKSSSGVIHDTIKNQTFQGYTREVGEKVEITNNYVKFIRKAFADGGSVGYYDKEYTFIAFGYSL